MKKILLTSVAAFGLAGTALAADLPARMPVRAPVMVAPVSSWTGCYIGGHVGGAWATAGRTWTVTDHYQVVGDAFEHDFDAFGGGGQVGCQYQFNQFVFGIEGTGTWFGNNNNDLVLSPFGSTVLSDPVAVSTNFDGIWTVVGRLGVTISPQFLLYAKGGYANVGLNSYIEDRDAAGALLHSSADSQRHSGWTVGVGGEWMFAPNWIVGVDYGFIHADAKTHAGPVNGLAPAAPLFYQTEIDADIHMLTGRISYLFNWGGPAARY